MSEAIAPDQDGVLGSKLERGHLQPGTGRRRQAGRICTWLLPPAILPACAPTPSASPGVRAAGGAGGSKASLLQRPWQRRQQAAARSACQQGPALAAAAAAHLAKGQGGRHSGLDCVVNNPPPCRQRQWKWRQVSACVALGGNSPAAQRPGLPANVTHVRGRRSCTRCRRWRRWPAGPRRRPKRLRRRGQQAEGAAVREGAQGRRLRTRGDSRSLEVASGLPPPSAGGRRLKLARRRLLEGLIAEPRR